MTAVTFSPDGRWAVVASNNGLISFFDGVTGAPVQTLKPGLGIFSVVFNRSGDVLAAGTAEGTVEFWDVKSLGLPK